MSTQILVIAGPDAGLAFPLGSRASLLIGRGQASGAKLVDPAVSRVHCEVRWDGAQAAVTDNASASGTFVNGCQVLSQNLRAGDVIKIGNTELRFEVTVAEDKTLPPDAVPRPTIAHPSAADAAARATAKPGPAPPEQPRKEVVFAQKVGGRPVPSPINELQELLGQTIGNYQLLKLLGTGQIGLVFQAMDVTDGKVVALKVLRRDFLTDAKGMARFVRGIKMARTFRHPHLITVYNAGFIKPHCWIAMEFIEGESLADMFKQLGPGGKMDWTRVLRVAVHVARALAFLHGHGVIHRNILPANILVRKNDQTAKLGDAMLSKSLQENQKQEVTAAGELVGNMYYMAPERTGNNEVDGRADLYSLGATLYHMATGQLPFAASSMVELIGKIRQARPENPKKFQPALPAPLEAVILKLLCKRPEDRFASAGEVLAALAPLTKTQAIS